MSEKKILQMAFRYFIQGKDTVLPPGHDCAVIRFGKNNLLAVTTDQLIENIHYKKNTPPGALAVKLLRRNISDIAACGATPLFAFTNIALNVSGEKAERWFNEFFRELGKESLKWKISICGGDIAKIAKSAPAVLGMTLIGQAKENVFCARNGAGTGDVLFCTGGFGNSFKSGRHLNFVPRLAEGRFLVGKWTRTMIDVSDGLLIDASRLAEASGKGLLIFPDKIPLTKGADLKSAFSDGEDYELLFAVPTKKADSLMSSWPFKTKLSKIGTFTSERRGNIFDPSGNNLLKKFSGGYEHFK
jgi:thiamine-monophosphate kinase